MGAKTWKTSTFSVPVLLFFVAKPVCA
jgi:hypothetical protein